MTQITRVGADLAKRNRAGGQVSHLAIIKFNREPGCEEV